MPRRYVIHRLLAPVALLVACGCSTHLARKVIQAPKNGFARHDPIARHLRAPMAVFPEQVLRAPDGETLSCRVMEAGDYGLSLLDIVDAVNAGRDIRLSAQALRPVAFKGTVLLLHGWGMTRESMLPWALELTRAGYRCLLMDLRGHGASSGARIGFGAWEVEDLKAALDQLQSRSILNGPLSVLGVSMGASLGLRLAAQDPRIHAVVALEPFWDARQAVESMARNFPPLQKKTVLLSDQKMAHILDKAARIGGFTWENARLKKDMGRLKVPALLFHGEDDTLVPPFHSEAILKAAPAGSLLCIIPKNNHLSLPLRVKELAPCITAWIERCSPPRREGR